MIITDNKLYIESKLPFFNFENIKKEVDDENDRVELTNHLQIVILPADDGLKLRKCRVMDEVRTMLKNTFKLSHGYS